MTQPTVFISYSHKDETEKEALLWADENNFMSSNVTDPVFVLLAGQKQRPLDVEIGQIFRGFCDTNLT